MTNWNTQALIQHGEDKKRCKQKAQYVWMVWCVFIFYLLCLES